jgi:hypothetical protein
MKRFGRHIVTFCQQPSSLIFGSGFCYLPIILLLSKVNFQKEANRHLPYWRNEDNNFFGKVKFFIDYLVSFDVLVNIW